MSTVNLSKSERMADRRQFVMGATQWQAFHDALDRPVQSKPRLKRLLRDPGVLEMGIIRGRE